MLILTRKKGEKIILDGEIEITIAEIKGREVKVGIKAPKGVTVLREEVYKEIQNQNKKAADAGKTRIPDIKI